MQIVKDTLAHGFRIDISLEKQIKNVLKAKFAQGLFTSPALDTLNITTRINTPEAYLLKEKTIAASLVLVKDEGNRVPLKVAPGKSVGLLSIGGGTHNSFQAICHSYLGACTHNNVPMDMTPAQSQDIYNTCKKVDVLIVSVHSMRNNTQNNFGLTPAACDLIWKLNSRTRVA
jgi:hypothetical protein